MNRKTINVGRVKGSMWYSGADYTAVKNPLEGDMFLDTVNVDMYQYQKGKWVLVVECNDFVKNLDLSIMKYKGNVESFDKLPTESLVIGDVYNVSDTGHNYVWDGEGWDDLGGTVKVDLTDYVTTNTEQAITGVKKFYNRLSAPYLYLDCQGDINDGTVNYSYIDRGNTAFCNIRIGPNDPDPDNPCGIYYISDGITYKTRDIRRIDRCIITGADNIIDTTKSEKGHLYNIALFADGSTVRGSNVLTSGWGNVVNNNATSALGVNLQTGSNQLGQLVIGEWNDPDTNPDNPAYFQIGNGTVAERHNVLSIEKNGIWFGGSNTTNGEQRIDKYITYKNLGKLLDMSNLYNIKDNLRRISQWEHYQQHYKEGVYSDLVQGVLDLSKGFDQTNTIDASKFYDINQPLNSVLIAGRYNKISYGNQIVVGNHNTTNHAKITAGSFLINDGDGVVIGNYNKPIGYAKFVIGNGLDENDRHNLIAFTNDVLFIGGHYQEGDKNRVDTSITYKNLARIIEDYNNDFGKDYVDNLVASIPKYQTTVVETLPEVGQPEVVYLVLDEEDSDSLYKEYIYVNGTWERLGTAKIKLDDYALKTEVPTKLSDLEIDMELGINEEEVLEVVESNSEEVEELETEVADSMEVQETETLDIATSDNYNIESDTQVPTTKAVKTMIDGVGGVTEDFVNEKISTATSSLQSQFNGSIGSLNSAINNKKLYFHRIIIKAKKGSGDYYNNAIDIELRINLYSTKKSQAVTGFIGDMDLLLSTYNTNHIVGYYIEKDTTKNPDDEGYEITGVGFMAMYYAGGYYNIYIQDKDGNHLANYTSGSGMFTISDVVTEV